MFTTELIIAPINRAAIVPEKSSLSKQTSASGAFRNSEVDNRRIKLIITSGETQHIVPTLIDSDRGYEHEMPEEEETPEDEIRLDAFLNWIWRGKWLIILLVIAASGLSAVLGMQQRETHTADALIETGRVWGKPIRDIYVTVESANSPGFIQDVAEKAGIKPGQLGRHVQVAAVESGRPRSFAPILIRVTATTETAEESVRLAQSMADEIIARHDKLFDEDLAPHLDQQHWIEAQLKSIGSSPADRDAALKLRTQLDEVISNNSSPISTARSRLIERIVPGSKARPDNWRGTVTAGLIAAIVGVVLACAIGYFKNAPRH